MSHSHFTIYLSKSMSCFIFFDCGVYTQIITHWHRHRRQRRRWQRRQRDAMHVNVCSFAYLQIVPNRNLIQWKHYWTNARNNKTQHAQTHLCISFLYAVHRTRTGNTMWTVCFINKQTDTHTYSRASNYYNKPWQQQQTRIRKRKNRKIGKWVIVLPI